MPDINNPNNHQNDRKYWVFAVKIIGDFGVTLAVPVVILVFLGQKLDQHYESLILFTVMGFILAALISGKLIYKKAKAYGKEYQELGQESNTK